MIDSRTAAYGALVLRVALGVLALSHGLTKLLVFTPAGTVGFFASLGLPGDRRLVRHDRRDRGRRWP